MTIMAKTTANAGGEGGNLQQADMDECGERAEWRGEAECELKVGGVNTWRNI